MGRRRAGEKVDPLEIRMLMAKHQITRRQLADRVDMSYAATCRMICGLMPLLATTEAKFREAIEEIAAEEAAATAHT